MNNITKFIRQPRRIINYVLYHTAPLWPDKLYLSLRFFSLYGYRINWEHPQTFSEKLNWLKLYDRKPIYHQMVDKAESKKLIDKMLGECRTVPTLGVYDSFEQIDWAALPNQFILKATHDSGSYYIVNDKKLVDLNSAQKTLYVHWYKDYYYYGREWQYKGLKKRIIAEPLIAKPEKLREFKIFCFNGEPKFYQLCLDRNRDFGGSIVQFVSLDGKLLDIKESSYNSRTTDNNNLTSLYIEKMISIATRLAENTFFLRVDFFDTGDQFYIGELTLHESSGFCELTPDRWNRVLGDWIKLPTDLNNRLK